MSVPRRSNCNHDRFKKKAAEEVDVSILVFFLVVPSQLTPKQDSVHFRVNVNKFDVYIRNSVGIVL